MDGLRSHPWVNKGFDEMPKRIQPKVISVVDEPLATVIQSINFDGSLMTYTLESRNKMNFGELSSLSRKNSNTSSEIAGRRRRDQVRGSISTIRRKHSPLAPSTLIENDSTTISDATATNAEQPVAGQELPLPALFPLKVEPDSLPKSTSLSNIPIHSHSSSEKEARNRTLSLSRASMISKRLSLSVANEHDPGSDSELEFDEIQEWHTIHMPPSEIRTKTFVFNHSLSSATLEPAIMFQHLHQAIMMLEEYQEGILTINREKKYYLLFCTYETPDAKVKFEVELFKQWIVNSHALHFQKVAGDSMLYKSMHDRIVEQIKWD